MGTDQGKLGNMHALGIISETVGVKMSKLGTTTFRPPYIPLSFGALVGRNVGEYFDISRKTPMHEWHLKNKEQQKEYSLKNKEHRLQQTREWRLRNKEKLKIWQHEYYLKNKKQNLKIKNYLIYTTLHISGVK